MIPTNDMHSSELERIISDIKKFMRLMIPRDGIYEFEEISAYCANSRYDQKPSTSKKSPEKPFLFKI